MQCKKCGPQNRVVSFRHFFRCLSLTITDEVDLITVKVHDRLASEVLGGYSADMLARCPPTDGTLWNELSSYVQSLVRCSPTFNFVVHTDSVLDAHTAVQNQRLWLHEMELS